MTSVPWTAGDMAAVNTRLYQLLAMFLERKGLLNQADLQGILDEAHADFTGHGVPGAAAVAYIDATFVERTSGAVSGDS